MKPFPGLVIALASEGRALFGRAGWNIEDGRSVRRLRTPDGADLVAVISGAGAGKARAAARSLVSQGANALAVVGVAGGLDPTLNPGDLVVAETVLGPEGADPGGRWIPDRAAVGFLCDALDASGIPVRRGAVITVLHPLLTTEEKRLVHRQSGALAVDMESAAVAGVAAERRVPLLVLRAVCDPADQLLPKGLVDCLGDDGKVRPMLLMRAIARKPALAVSAIRTKRSWSRALNALKRAWETRSLPGLLSRLASGGNPGNRASH